MSERERDRAADTRPTDDPTPAGEDGYTPSIPTLGGGRLASDDAVAQAGTGRSGPHDIGTRPGDPPPTEVPELAAEDSPTARLWRQGERAEPRRHQAGRRTAPEVEPPTPPDNPGGPPP